MMSNDTTNLIIIKKKYYCVCPNNFICICVYARLFKVTEVQKKKLMLFQKTLCFIIIVYLYNIRS